MPATLHRCLSRAIAPLLLGGLGLLADPQAQAIVFDDTGSTTYNTAAPDSSHAGSGWQWQGTFGSYLGTMIGPQHFITAQHFGVAASTFVSSSVFNGVGDVTYNLALDGFGQPIYTDIAGTDLRVFQVVETFASYATLYNSADELGHEIVVMGRGGPRGSDLLLDTGLGMELKGWRTGGADGVARWGTNTVSSLLPNILSPVGDLLAFDFNHGAGAHEATLSSGDSGGGIFIQQFGVWKLAGINYGADGPFDTNATVGDGSAFDAALFDVGGYFTGSDAGGWNYQTDTPLDNSSSAYGSRISTSASAIQAITGVPEPSGVLLLLAAAGANLRRRKR